MQKTGKKLTKIDKWTPSSKKCSRCGYINHNLTIDDRIFVCPICGLTIDRDLNNKY